MEFYLSRDIHTRINLKTCFVDLCGIEFALLGRLFTFRERMDMFEGKLRLEGII